MIFTQAASNPALGIDIGKVIVDLEGKLSSIFFFVVWMKKILISDNLITSIANLGIGLIICIVLSLLLKFFAERNYLEILRKEKDKELHIQNSTNLLYYSKKNLMKL